MRKGEGRLAQIRGHKRAHKIANARKNRNINSYKPNPGEKYLTRILEINNEE